MNVIRRWLDCRFTRGAIVAYLDGEAPPARARIEAHIAACDRCRRLADDLRAQARAIESLPAEGEPQSGFVTRVMDRISVTRVATGPSIARRTQPAWRPALAAVAAAVAIILVALALRPMMSGQPSRTFRVPSVPPQVAQKAPVEHELATAPQKIAQRLPEPAPEPSPARVKPRPSVPLESRTPAPPTALAAAQEHRTLGESYEADGQLDAALQEYAAARDRDGSTMARLDMARVYEKGGHTAEALDELVQVAFADIDDSKSEPMTLD